MTQKILGFSGKKQSGKTTSAHFILGFEMCALGLVRGGYTMPEDGKLHITDLWGNSDGEGIFDPDRNNDAMHQFLKDEVHSHFRLYSMADLLKRHVCIDILGLTHKQCYGTDEDKDSLTHLKWENMPGVLTEADLTSKVTTNLMVKKVVQSAGLLVKQPGNMTAREVMQFVGTDVFRRMYAKVWVDSTVNKIVEDGSQFAVITDLRFPDEVEGVQAAGGKVVRLTRKVSEEEHKSETALDKENFDWSKFDKVIDNQELTLAEKNKQVLETLFGWDWYQTKTSPVQDEVIV